MNYVSPKSIFSIERITLNGVNQYISIRSENIENPVILFLHGGPGISEMPLLRIFNHDLENNYTLVHWEQRGTGKSFNRNIPDSGFTIAQFVSDAYELSNYLIKRFKRDKIYIIGHSWGSIIGIKLAQQYPDLYHAYIGMGQMVDVAQAEKISFSFTINKALKLRNRKAVRQLRKADNPNFLTIENNKNWYKQLKTQRKWLVRFKGFIYKHSLYMKLLNAYWYASEYSLFDLIRFLRGSVYSIKKMWPEIMKVNLFNTTLNFKIPIYFFQGIYDFNSPTELVKEYYKEISAPDKELFIFENSAHAPNYEENIKFNSLVDYLFQNIEHKEKYPAFTTREYKVHYED